MRNDHCRCVSGCVNKNESSAVRNVERSQKAREETKAYERIAVFPVCRSEPGPFFGSSPSPPHSSAYPSASSPLHFPPHTQTCHSSDFSCQKQRKATQRSSGSDIIKALVSSLASTSTDDRTQPPSSGSQAARISETLKQLLDNTTTEGSGITDENGKLINEEGLPIIEISEPAPEAPPALASGSVATLEDLNITPLATLSPIQKELRRRERDRILDILEEEERDEQRRSEEKEKEELRLALERQKEAAKRNFESLKAQREMQKKMGKALISNISAAREREHKREENSLAPSTGPRQSRKTVTFAPSPDSEGQPSPAVSLDTDWGDVFAGRLKSGVADYVKHPGDSGPMKFNVIERTSSRSSVAPENAGDSDDESNAAASTESEDEDDGNPAVVDSASDEEADPPGADLEVHEDGLDFDSAQHQREIALAYYEKRATIGTEALTAMSSYTHDEGEGEWDQPEVPLDATLAHNQPTPGVSRFKAARSAHVRLKPSPSSTSPSASLGSGILPASQTGSLRNSIRVGKLVDGQLTGGPQGESDSEDENEMARQVFEALKRGEEINVGPSPSLDAPSTTRIVPRDVKERTPASPSTGGTVTKTIPGADPNSDSTFASEFKPGPAQLVADEGLSQSPIPLSTVERPSSKLAEDLSAGPNTSAKSASPIQVPSSTSRRPPRASGNISKTSEATSPPVNSLEASVSVLNPTSLVVDSPSFPRLTGTPNQPTVIDSPSFPTTRPSQSATRSSSTGYPHPRPVSTVQPVVTERAVASRAETNHSQSEQQNDSNPRRVSRFKMNRM